MHVHRNRDGTVDGELRISNIKRGYRIVDLLTDVSIIMYGSPGEPSDWRLAKGHWISIGGLTDWGGTKEDWLGTYAAAKARGMDDAEARAHADKAASPLPRYRGQSRVALYPQRAEDFPSQVFRAQQGMLGEAHRDRQSGKMLGRGTKSKPTEILVRVYWNHLDKRPGRK